MKVQDVDMNKESVQVQEFTENVRSLLNNGGYEVETTFAANPGDAPQEPKMVASFYGATYTLYLSFLGEWYSVSLSKVAGGEPSATTHSAATLGTDAATILTLVGQMIGLQPQAATKFLAGPLTGPNYTPTFRAISKYDLPTDAMFVGTLDSEGSWKILQSGATLSFQQYLSGVWTEILSMSTTTLNLTGRAVTAKDISLVNAGTVTRTAGLVSSIAITGGRTKTYTRNSSGFVTGMADGAHTWTYVRDVYNNITSWSVV